MDGSAFAGAAEEEEEAAVGESESEDRRSSRRKRRRRRGRGDQPFEPDLQSGATANAFEAGDAVAQDDEEEEGDIPAEASDQVASTEDAVAPATMELWRAKPKGSSAATGAEAGGVEGVIVRTASVQRRSSRDLFRVSASSR